MSGDCRSYASDGRCIHSHARHGVPGGGFGSIQADGQNLFDDTPDITADNAYSVKLNSVASVPEPATWLAMLVGFGAIGLTFRRSRRSLAPGF